MTELKPESGRARRWLERLIDSPHALWLIFTASFLESIIVPIPLELILIPFMVIERDRVWKIATFTLAGCLLGALVGYSAGFFLFDTVGQWVIDTSNYQSQYETFKTEFEANGFWAIVAVGITPIPFQVAMLTAGATQYSLGLFMLAAFIARGIRYFGLALLVVWLGEPALRFWQKNAKLIGTAILVLFVGVIAATQIW